MRKRLIGQQPGGAPRIDEKQWLRLDALAAVEVTSEDAAHPIESALLPGGDGSGWRAAASGEQRVRILFDTPQPVRRIRLVFEETETARMQEFALRWSTPGEVGWREIVRQQYNFSPTQTTTEVEDYNVHLSEVAVLELVIVPDVEHARAPASLKQMRIAC